MEAYSTNSGLTPVLSGASSTQQSNMWRPWSGNQGETAPCVTTSTHGNVSTANITKPPQVVHPVKLFWPKSRCFDYLYQDAKMLLRNYPVQATICPCRDSSSDEESDEEEEEAEKELN
ncbi:protein ripply2 [Acanthochromis polyacanthus]|uniref:protein ripply2 n=1 Tax=Acanthochromis polyacanthus TaxID=80966 RepID=UPI0022346433|nr:protein ripply2 [Acanthochromis polyacanthus]